MELILAAVYVQVFILIYLTVLFFVLFLLYNKRVYYTPRILTDEELPSLTVVIPMYNEGEALKETLDAIVSCDYPKEKLSVIVVDDASTDNSYEIAKAYERYGFVKVIKHKTNMGAAMAKNTGIKLAHSELVATLDSDSIVEKDTFRRLASYFAAEPDTMAVTATIRVYKPRTLIERVQALEYDTILFFRRLMSFVESIYVTPGGLSMFRRAVFERIGFFDPRTLTEDLEIALRLQRAGYKIRAALDAVVYTKVPRTVKALIKQRVRWVRGGLWNRIHKHRDMFDVKMGDFFMFGMVMDVLLIIPSTVLITVMLYKFISKPDYQWAARLGISSFLMSVFTDMFIVIGAALFIVTLLWTVYAINRIRDFAGEVHVSWRDAPALFIFLFLYGYMWPYVWAESIYKEVRGYERKWETR